MSMRVVHILTSNALGGAEQLVMSLCEAMAQSDLETYYLSPNGPIAEVVTARNLNYVPVSLNNPLRLRQQVLTLKPDVIHAHDFKAMVMSAYLFPKCKVIGHVHHSPDWQRQTNPMTWLLRATMQRLTRVVYVSEAARTEFRFAQEFEHKTTMIANGVDFKRVRELAMQAPKHSDMFDVLFVGRLEPVKAPLQFIKLIGQLKERFPTVKAAMIGDGSMQADCQALIQNLGLQGNLELLGALSNPYPHLQAAHIVCSTSQKDAFGLVTVEAAVLQTMPFGPNITGLKTTLQAVGGQVYDTPDQALQLITNYLASTEAYRPDQSKLAEFSITRTAKALIALYDQVIQGG